MVLGKYIIEDLDTLKRIMAGCQESFEGAKEAVDKLQEDYNLRTSKSHELYLKTHYWRKRKAAYWENNPKQCFLCKRNKNIHLHHRTYDNLWKEPDSDLIRLCGMHHNELHSYEYLYDLSVEDATDVYLAHKANVNIQGVLHIPRLRDVMNALVDWEDYEPF